MKLSGDVEVANRLLPSLNMARRRAERSYLSIGTFPGKQPEPFVLLQTLKNGAGVRYKVIGNIENVFARFVAEGKATIRFTKPPHDLIIKCRPEELKNFLRVLKLCLSGKADPTKPKIFQLSNLAAAPTKVQPKARTKLVVTTKKDYPQLEGFPRTLEILQLNCMRLKKLDGRILRLQNLIVLNLEDNNLESLPAEIDLLPNLRELHLARNNFGSLTSDWNWLKGINLRSCLQLLDLRFNELSQLPCHIVRLVGLKSLLLDNNSLRCLPNGIGLLTNLQFLHVSNNAIRWWPGSFRLLRLNCIDISINMSPVPQEFCRDLDNLAGNRFETSAGYDPSTLLDISAQQVLHNRIAFSDWSIPLTLSHYLEDACYCECGRPTFPGRPEGFLSFRMKRISPVVTFSHETQSFIAVRYCSDQCRRNCPPDRFLHFNFVYKLLKNELLENDGPTEYSGI